jgi:nicotinate-nucleotide pyrophosphorylase (carboxylating)
MDFATVQYLVDNALSEDLSTTGDVTSDAVFADQESSMVLVSKDSGVLAGSRLFEMVFESVDADSSVEFHRTDGADLRPGEIVAAVRGRIRSLLAAERPALNFLSFLSGIATNTRKFVEAAAASGSAQILDTRKTLPGYRALSKYAVAVGGGTNHRMGLYDMVMLKDNHIDLAGSIGKAVAMVRERWGNRYRVEVECRTVAEVEEAQQAGADVIMLDNMSEDEIRNSVAVRRPPVKLEISGNMDVASVRRFSGTGVDYISVGKLTHSVSSFDFSLKSEGDAASTATRSATSTGGPR